ncbi:MAG: two-component system response regulator [Salinibacter sp.]
MSEADSSMLFSHHSSFEDASILLAIEHSTSAELLEDRLQRRGVSTRHEQNGEDALRAVETEGSPDLLVAQTSLPGRTGLELLRRVPYLDPAVVLLGLEGNDEIIIRAFEFGAADYITRPFAPRVATTRILRFL